MRVSKASRCLRVFFAKIRLRLNSFLSSNSQRLLDVLPRRAPWLFDAKSDELAPRVKFELASSAELEFSEKENSFYRGEASLLGMFQRREHVKRSLLRDLIYLPLPINLAFLSRWGWDVMYTWAIDRFEYLWKMDRLTKYIYIYTRVGGS